MESSYCKSHKICLLETLKPERCIERTNGNVTKPNTTKPVTDPVTDPVIDPVTEPNGNFTLPAGNDTESNGNITEPEVNGKPSCGDILNVFLVHLLCMWIFCFAYF